MKSLRAEKPGRMRRACRDYLGGVAGGFVSLLRGMGVTMGYFVRTDRIVTRQYPENRDTLQMMNRFRGCLVMPHDEHNRHNCTACGICEKACPNGSISVLATKDASGRRILGRYLYRLAQCTLCNLCVESCPYGAIAMGREFELAVYDRGDLTLELNRGEEAADA